jgi:hypothetical protein
MQRRRLRTMEKKIKLKNANAYDIGFTLENPHRDVNIKPGSFAIVSEDDVYFLNSTCSLLKKGRLFVESENIEEVNRNLGFEDEKPVILNKDEILELIQGNFLKMKSGLEKYKEPYEIGSIYQIAKDNVENLTGGKIKFLNEFCGRSITD